MQRRLLAILMILTGLVVGLTACSGSAPTQSLPTATLAQTDAPAQPTATPQPPPTVTPFPTGTPLPTPTPTPETEEAAIEGNDETNEAESDTPEVTSAPTASTDEGSATASDFERGDRRYSTDFSSGWPTLDDTASDSQSATVDGADTFDLAVNRQWVVATTVLTIDDFIAEVDVTPDTCPEGAGYGLFFRYVDGDNYFALTFFCGGRVTVFARSGGVLVQPPLLDMSLPDGLDASSTDTHQITVAARGSEFAIMFDGEIIGGFSSELHAEGDLALYAVSGSTAGMQIAFDNLEVYRAQ